MTFEANSRELLSFELFIDVSSVKMNKYIVPWKQPVLLESFWATQ